jgi:hypothetical protein
MFGEQSMLKLVVAMIIVAAVLIGGLLALLRNRRQPMGTPEVLDRVRQRNRDLEAQERRENAD